MNIKFLKKLLHIKTTYRIRLAQSTGNTLLYYHSIGLLDIDRYVESSVKALLGIFDDTLQADDFTFGNDNSSSSIVITVHISQDIADRVNKIAKRCQIEAETIILTALIISFTNMIADSTFQELKKGGKNEK